MDWNLNAIKRTEALTVSSSAAVTKMSVRAERELEAHAAASRVRDLIQKRVYKLLSRFDTKRYEHEDRRS